MTQQPEANQVPLVELLAAVPADIRIGVDDGNDWKAGTTWHPVGQLCHEAAAELRRLHQSERDGWRYAKEWEARATRLAKALGQAMETLEEIAYGLESARIWGGMDWTYNPLHPFKYLPLRDKARAAISKATGEQQ